MVCPPGISGREIACDKCGMMFGCFGPSPTIRGICNECAALPGPGCKRCNKSPRPGFLWLFGFCSEECQQKGAAGPS